MNKLNELNARIGRYRWTICALVFAATTINYLDRNVLGLLKETLSGAGVFGADKAGQELNYSTVVICFQVAYAVGMLGAGRLIDRVGTKSGYAYSLIGWSLAAIGHAFGHATWSFGFWRAALSGSPRRNAPLPPACTTPVPTSARLSHPCACPTSRPPGAGNGPSS